MIRAILLVVLIVLLGFVYIEHRLKNVLPRTMHNTPSVTVPGLKCTAYQSSDHYIVRIECDREVQP